MLGRDRVKEYGALLSNHEGTNDRHLHSLSGLTVASCQSLDTLDVACMHRDEADAARPCIRFPNQILGDSWHGLVSSWLT